MRVIQNQKVIIRRRHAEQRLIKRRRIQGFPDECIQCKMTINEKKRCMRGNIVQDRLPHLLENTYVMIPGCTKERIHLTEKEMRIYFGNRIMTR